MLPVAPITGESAAYSGVNPSPEHTRRVGDLASRCVRDQIMHRDWHWSARDAHVPGAVWQPTSGRSGEHPQPGDGRGDGPDRLQAGREARSPGLSVSAGTPVISILTSPSSTWIVSRWPGVHRAGPPAAVNRVSPARTPPARASWCIWLPGTCGSGSRSAVLTAGPNTPGCGSIIYLPACQCRAGSMIAPRPLAHPRPHHAEGRRPGTRPERISQIGAHQTGEPITSSDWHLSAAGAQVSADLRGRYIDEYQGRQSSRSG